jgi:hypothetical protein
MIVSGLLSWSWSLFLKARRLADVMAGDGGRDVVVRVVETGAGCHGGLADGRSGTHARLLVGEYFKSIFQDFCGNLGKKLTQGSKTDPCLSKWEVQGSIPG